jgi:hypothetical protein
MQDDIANLRRARIRVHKRLRETEALLAGYKAKLGAIETAIYEIDPELKLPLQHRQYSQIFKRGEYTRITLGVLRDAGTALPLREIALRALAVKDVALPDYRLRKVTRHRIGTTLPVLAGRGIVEKLGSANKWAWRLAGDERHAE